jgi:hypothetical protein
MKFNEWCHRKPVVDDSDKYFKALSKVRQFNVSEISRAALLQKEMLDNEGIEFMVFSNLKFEKQIKFDNGLELVPCFYPELNGGNFNDPIHQASAQMHNRARYLYDGWLPITNWDAINISEKLESIEEILSLFSLTGLIYFEWEPKYFYKRKTNEIIYADTHLNQVSIIEEIAVFANDLNKLDIKDRLVIYKSISWINKAKSSNDPITAFLFYMLSIENLVHYIEEGAKNNSAFFKIRTISNEEKDKQKKECIYEMLKDIQSDNEPWKIVQKAYTDCVYGIKNRIERQINRAFIEGDKLRTVFNEKINKKSLYDIRSKIAHGDVNTLNTDEIDEINKRIYDLKDLAINYILSVLYKCDILYPERTFHGSISCDMDNSILSSVRIDKGPTHMSLYYFGRI